MSNNMLPRVCRECGMSFMGGPRAWYCPGCRTERQLGQNREYKARKRSGKIIPVGSFVRCETCGREIVKNSGQQRFCSDCAPIHLKQVDNAQSLSWKRANPEKIKQFKRIASKKSYDGIAGKESGIKYISWDKGHKKWRVSPVINGKQIYGGRYNTLDEAEIELHKILETEKGIGD